MIPTSKNDPAWHIFAATLVTTPALQGESQKQYFVESVQFTQRWDDIDGERVQFVEVVVVNTPTHGDAAQPITVEVHSRTAKTLKPARVTRLPKGNFIRVDVPVTGGNGDKERATVTIRDANSGHWLTISPGWLVQPGLTDYDSSDASLSRVQAPNWWRDAKLGIMFHYGPYSVPAYGADFYAEWYMHDMSTNNYTKAHHLKTYGEQFNYDDFFEKFTAAKFDASQWVALMEASGARYSVGTTKHHDGFALFDTKDTSNRNSLTYGPKRDLMKELMLAAQNSTVRFGTYFSPVEWFNPIQNPYGFELFAGGPYRNAYTGEAVPYTGFIEKDDFIDDIQSPQQQILMEDYRTNIMWCDIGGPSRGCQNAAKWYNEARKRGQNVVMNNRCGCLWNGFGTPEYATYSGTVQNLWETNEGLAPFSFGFNAQDAPSAYKTPQQLVKMLVDVVSKNGNYLINFGPEASGVIPKAQQDSLLGMGKWLKTNGEAIYGTRYWNLTPQEGDWRFTTKDGLFYMISLSKPSTSYTFTSPIPVRNGDVITLLGAKGIVKYTINEKGLLTINPTATQIGQGNLAWAFRIEQK
ncbi:glycoside hydrolase family 29 protein [Meira miltonrushii]|uniref:alpha-L-fucosidase n=1 Tax=Meira miltonrushii TaxID=1280837 RepID=A0A316VGY1_9BASI|nr:glycoside hydrolase family 29 protein [Meira miltonrushii]PWN34765.1 glycoside hydrolase family 29 protein [Meira miltonrushii]